MPLITRQATFTNVTGPQISFNLDPLANPFLATVMVTLIGAATCTYGIQYSLDDPITVTDANANWLYTTGLPSGTTASGSTGFDSPVQRARINIAALSGSVLVQWLQGIGN